MPVLPTEAAASSLFTLIRRPGVSDTEFAKDRAAIENDLKTLKALRER